MFEKENLFEIYLNITISVDKNHADRYHLMLLY